MATTKLLLHPVRLRIVQEMLDGQPLTTSQLRTRLPDIPTATMYRQVVTLSEAGVLEVIAERRVRGAVERTYRLRREAAELDASVRAAMTPEDHRQAFAAFASGILAEFDRYLAHPSADPTADLVTYRQAALWLTDEELTALLDEVRAAVTSRMAQGPGPGRRRRLLWVVHVPEPE